MFPGMHGFAYASPMWGRGIGSTLWSVGGILLLVALLALAVTAIVALVRSTRRTTKSDSLEILRGRFARGEISKEEFEQMRRTLTT